MRFARFACPAIHTNPGDEGLCSPCLLCGLLLLVRSDGRDDHSHPITAATVMHEKTTLCRSDEGATAVEAALVISLLMSLTFGIVEFGMALWNWNTMGLAVQDAGRYVMINNASCDTSCAVSQMQALLVTAPGTVSTTC